MASLNEPTSRPFTFVTKDSGKREERPSGYVRDTQEGKPRFDLLLPVGIPYEHQMLTRVAQLLSRGAAKYSERNWERANDVESLERFRASALRHLLQWMSGETDEDHASAVMYNVLAHESTKWKMENLEDSTAGHRDQSEPSAPLESVWPGQHIFDPAYGVVSDDLLGCEVVSESGDDFPEDDDGWWDCTCYDCYQGRN